MYRDVYLCEHCTCKFRTLLTCLLTNGLSLTTTRVRYLASYPVGVLYADGSLGMLFGWCMCLRVRVCVYVFVRVYVFVYM